MKLEVAGAEIAYERAGDGEPVLMVQGLGAPRMAWFHQWQVLPKTYDVTIFDNRGCGETVCQPGSSWTIADMASDAIALADHVGYERFHLVGISMGGIISQELVLGHPNRVISLTLIATTPGGPESVPITAEYMAALMIPDPVKRARRCIELLFGERYRAENPAMVDIVVQVMTSSGTGGVATLGTESVNALGFAQQIAAVADWVGRGGSADRLGEIRAPTLVMHGTEDHLLPVENGKLLARDIPGARLRIFEGAGHALIHECAEDVNREIVAHLEGAHQLR